jgi:Tol biopolymer transport system component
VIALALLLSVMMFFTQFAHPLVSPLAANNPATLPIRGDLYVMHASGYVQTRLTLNQQDASSPSWSPDGFHIAFSAGEQGKSGIFVIQDDASGMKRLTPTATDSSEPAWSPNGRQIAYVATLNGASHIMLMNADGTKPQQLTTGTGNDYGPQWSPNGRQIIFESNRSGDFNLYTISATGKGQPTQLTRTSGSDDFQPSWSPDGKLIAFVSTRDGDAQVFVMDAKGSGQRRLTNTGSNFGPAWRPGGKQIAFVSSRSGNDEIYLMNADGSHLVNLSNNAGFDDGVGLMAWSRDGRALAYGAVGHPAIDSEMSTALGIASILLQAALMMAILLLALRRWSLPPGVATLIFTVSAVLISFIHDEFKLIPVALVAGIAADVLLLVLRPGPGRIRQLRIFAFAVPVIFFALYFVALALTGGVAWVIHLWFGAPIMAGIVGLFLSYVTVPPNLGVSLPAFDK